MHFGLKYYRSFWNYAAERDTDTVPLYVTDINLDPATITLQITPQSLELPSQTFNLSTHTLHLSSVPGAAMSLVRDAETWEGKLDDSTSLNTKIDNPDSNKSRLDSATYRGGLTD